MIDLFYVIGEKKKGYRSRSLRVVRFRLYKLLFLERSEFRFECDVCQAKPAVPQDRALYASLIR